MTLSFKKLFQILYPDELLFGVHVCLHVIYIYIYIYIYGISSLHPHPWDPHCFS